VTATGTTGPTGAGGSSDVCFVGCQAVAQCGVVPGCEQGCQSVGTKCSGIHRDWLFCLARGLGSSCADVPACQPALSAYLECQAFCMEGGCFQDSGGGCGCTTSCGALYETECAPAGMGQMACACRVDGASIGKCVGPAPSPFEACSIELGCCAALFFVDG
jgi:hypothetical protein